MARQANEDRGTSAAAMTAATDKGPRRRSRQRGEGRPANPPGHTNGAPSQPGPARLMLDVDFVRELIAAVDESGIDTLEINRAGTRIRISKTPAGTAAPPEVAAAAPPAAAGEAVPAAPAIPTEPEPSPEPETNLIDVTSPMVGTFYRSPAPEAPPYVEVGSHISKGQTLCILEAMKLMNELEAEVDGVVREILAENTDPVEYGQVLFRIEPAGS